MTAQVSGFGVGNNSVHGRAFKIDNKTSNLNVNFETDLKSKPADNFRRARQIVTDLYQDGMLSAKDVTLREILEAQLALVQDPELEVLILEQVESGKSLQNAIDDVIADFANLLVGEIPEFESRIADIQEIGSRLKDAVSGEVSRIEFPSEGEWIVIAEDLTPLETSRFTKAVRGVITSLGGPTSHTAIVCRQLKIPALVGCGDISMVEPNIEITLDPLEGLAYVGKRIEKRNLGSWWSGAAEVSEPLFRPLGNVGSKKDAELVQASGALGVGLLRTELLFLSTTDEPSIDVQRELYTDIVSSCPVGEVIFRTLDAGTDKPIPFLRMEREENPALGVRGQRVSWTNPDFFKNQLQAIKDISVNFPNRSISVMAPMIADRKEAIEFANLATELGFASIGIMVEVPSIIEDIAFLPNEISFLSIGTNDLSQYLFAADRQNSRVAHLLDPWHPILLKTIARICLLGKKQGLKIGICGEAASDPFLSAVLVGLGIDSLSAGAGSVAELVEISKRLNLELANEAANLALDASTPSDARAAVKDLLTKVK
jgi:phosphotransferase system enzyme I (PtsI)